MCDRRGEARTSPRGEPIRSFPSICATAMSQPLNKMWLGKELLSNLVFEGCWSCGDLVGVCGFDSVFERDACDDFREVVKAA